MAWYGVLRQDGSFIVVPPPHPTRPVRFGKPPDPTRPDAIRVRFETPLALLESTREFWEAS